MLADPNEHRTNLDGSTLWQLGAAGAVAAGARRLSRVARRRSRRSRGRRRGSTALGLYPSPVRVGRVRILHTPWLFRLPWFRRFHGYTMWPLILLARPLAEVSDDLIVHELCHVWQMQHHPVCDAAVVSLAGLQRQPERDRGAGRRGADR